jgi:uncharacterized protein YbjT (DUF2867 family)
MKVLVTGSSGLVGSALVPFLAAVVHLAGESIAEGRWTVERKAQLLGKAAA